MSDLGRPQVRALIPGDVIVVELPCSVVVRSLEETGDGGPMIGNMKLHFTDAKVMSRQGDIRIGERVGVEILGHDG